MGPEERRLRRYVEPAAREQVESARAAWQEVGERLHDLAEALLLVVPLAPGAAARALRAVLDEVNTRTEQLRLGALALERAASAIAAAERLRDGFDAHPLDRPSEPRWSHDPMTKVTQEARHGLVMAAYDIEYSMREGSAARAVARLDTTFRDSSDVMRGVHAERPDPAPSAEV